MLEIFFSIMNYITNYIIYDERYRQALSELKVEWISKYFITDAADYKVLDHPYS
jgi:hypothetical protein